MHRPHHHHNAPHAPEVQPQTPYPDNCDHAPSKHCSHTKKDHSTIVKHHRGPSGSSTGGSLSLHNPDNIFDNPLLISSVVPSTPVEEVESKKSDHAMVVDKMVRVLLNAPSTDHAMEGSLSDTSLSSDEPDDNTILSNFQNEAKLEALVKHGPSKSCTTPKKGRKSSNP